MLMTYLGRDKGLQKSDYRSEVSNAMSSTKHAGLGALLAAILLTSQAHAAIVDGSAEAKIIAGVKAKVECPFVSGSDGNIRRPDKQLRQFKRRLDFILHRLEHINGRIKHVAEIEQGLDLEGISSEIDSYAAACEALMDSNEGGDSPEPNR